MGARPFEQYFHSGGKIMNLSLPNRHRMMEIRSDRTLFEIEKIRMKVVAYRDVIWNLYSEYAEAFRVLCPCHAEIDGGIRHYQEAQDKKYMPFFRWVDGRTKEMGPKRQAEVEKLIGRQRRFMKANTWLLNLDALFILMAVDQFDKKSDSVVVDHIIDGRHYICQRIRNTWGTYQLQKLQFPGWGDEPFAVKEVQDVDVKEATRVKPIEEPA